MADSKRYIDWYEKAKKDLTGAKILYEHDGDNSLVAFHCQQAIEKLLKGYVLKINKRLLDGHSLIYLIRQTILFDNNMDKYVNDCAFVNQFYIETRYPADVVDIVENDEAEQALQTAEKLYSYITGKE